MQIAALALAAAGVTLLAVQSGEVPWISLSLAASFSLYAYVRKIAAAEAMVGLFVETLLLAPLALGYIGYLAYAGVGVFGPSDLTPHVEADDRRHRDDDPAALLRGGRAPVADDDAWASCSSFHRRCKC